MLLTTTAKEKTLFAGIRIYSRLTAGFTDQRTALTRAQKAIMQSRDFKLCVERAAVRYKVLIREINISKTDPVALLFQCERYSMTKAKCMCEIVNKTGSGIFQS